MLLRRRAARRRGMTIVESALVLSVFLMLLFGLFEYCRFLMVLHLTNNAARDGARYAVVNVNCPSDQVDAKKTAIRSVNVAAFHGVRFGSDWLNGSGYTGGVAELLVFGRTTGGDSTSPAESTG